MLRFILLLMREPEGAVIPAVLRGVPTVVTSAVAVLTVVATTSTSSSARMATAPSFASTVCSTCVAIIMIRVPVRVRRHVSAVVISPYGAMRVTVSTTSSSLTSTIVSSQVPRCLVCDCSQRTLVTASLISAASRASSNGSFFSDFHRMVRARTRCYVFKT